MDFSSFYGVLTAAAAISSGFAGARAAYLSREAGPSEMPVDRLTLSKSGSEITRVQQAVREAVSERCAGAQNAAAWLAASTALFGVAGTRSVSDPMGLSFLAIGAGLVIVAIQAILKANDAAKLPAARAAFEEWYLPWIHGRITTAARPTDEEIADAFSKQNPRFASALRRFEIWPFHFADPREKVPASSRPWSW